MFLKKKVYLWYHTITKVPPMKYKIEGSIQQSQREAVNNHILKALNSGSDGIRKQQIFNAYTGEGGLHGLKFKDYSSYHAYSEAKKEIENGQFYTPPSLAKDIVDVVDLKESETVIDPTCGIGVFCNFMPIEMNFSGIDICSKSIKVASHLYPQANWIEGSLIYQQPEESFDVVLGNPPFHLKWYDKDLGKNVSSESFFFKKCAELLKQGGVVAAIVPTSFLSDDFYYKSVIASINKNFNFVGQYQLENNAFSYLGVKNFSTKVMYLQKKSTHIKDAPYTNTITTKEEIKAKLSLRHKLKGALQLEFNKSIENDDFGYKLKKYLFEIKTHSTISNKLDSAIAYITKYNTQVCPVGMEEKQWNKIKLTKKKVLSYLKRIVKSQQKKAVNKTPRIVKTRHTFVTRGKVPRDQKRTIAIDSLVESGNYLPTKIEHPFNKLVINKIDRYNLITMPFSEMDNCPKIGNYLSGFSFQSHEQTCKFNSIQSTDLNKLIQKGLGVCNWQQGGGKTGGCYAFMKYYQKRVKKTIIIAPSIAVKTTWTEFLDAQGEDYKIVSNIKDLKSDSKIFLISFNTLIKYNRKCKGVYKFKKELAKLVKRLSQKATLIMDESDEICSNGSRRSKFARDVFRRVKYKLLATGTTTRNNITELYPQLELLYNNSLYMKDTCKYKYKQEKDGSIKEHLNKTCTHNFKARGGYAQFKACFNPSRGSVFGITKQNQDVYNTGSLLAILGQSIITRKFKEIAGDKFTVHTEYINQNLAERDLYGLIIQDFIRICREYYGSTGNSRKDSALMIVRQMQLLYKSCSTPNLMKHYEGVDMPTKLLKIEAMCNKFNERVAIGCTRKDTVKLYAANFKKRFPKRDIFVVDGGKDIIKRRKITNAFEKSENGILICTQQSLSSSVNIPSCDRVILEGLQWNIPRMEQFYFRFIRFNSKNHTHVHFVCYDGTIEKNILALMMDKEKINEFIKTKSVDSLDGVYNEFGMDEELFNNLMSREYDEKGKGYLTWGGQKME